MGGRGCKVAERSGLHTCGHVSVTVGLNQRAVVTPSLVLITLVPPTAA